LVPVDPPLKYFAEAPIVTISAGEQVLARTRVEGRVAWRLRVPSAALARSSGVVALTTDCGFRPSDAGFADRRELALRSYDVFGSR
jgi:hypothetical protein